MIAAWGMERLPVCGDGNCCFSAVASGMIMTHLQTHFHEVGIQSMDNADILGHQLRPLAVREWKDNKDYYKGFLVDTDTEVEADSFLQSGYFNSQLGDTMVLALANALGIPMIIFTTMLCHAVVHITPRHTKSHTPIYLAYSHGGTGHYGTVSINMIA